MLTNAKVIKENNGVRKDDHGVGAKGSPLDCKAK